MDDTIPADKASPAIGRQSEPPESDEQLMLAFAAGQCDSFAVLFDRYKQPLFGFFRRRLADPAQAEELAQETFIAVLRSADRYQPSALFRTFLYSIALRILRAHRRKAAFRATFFGEQPVGHDPAGHSNPVVDLFMREAMAQLNNLDREVLLLREFEQLSYAEIADVLALPVKHGPLAALPGANSASRLARSPRSLTNTQRSRYGGARMIATAHPVSPEEIMAMLDAELAPAEASAVSAHIAECPECASLAAQLRDTSESLARWTVPPPPSSLEEAVKDAAAKTLHDPSPARSSRHVGPKLFNWNPWASGGGWVIAAVAILIVFSSTTWVLTDKPFRRQRSVSYLAQSTAEPGLQQPIPASPMPAAAQNGSAMMNTFEPPSPSLMAGQTAVSDRFAPLPSKAKQVVHEGIVATGAASTAPMIAHTVSLTVQVRDLSAARAALEALLARHHGYAAQLTVNTAENSPPSLQSSLRVPDAELAAAVTEMRSLGRVETETQSGEEVTQQHADLVARLQNSRETEQRLRAILDLRTGKIEDVLQVEEQIARVRGEIEQMEAEQKVLEHRVDFATIDLQLAEQYREQLGPQSASVPMQIRNAFVSGLRHGADLLLGILFFIEEAGPTVLILLAILAVPGFLMWRRYRRMLQRQ